MPRPDAGSRARRSADARAGTPFIVLTTPRSGSTWFLDVLGRVPGATAHTELFLPRRKPRGERSMSWQTAEYLDRNLRGHPLFCETGPQIARRPWSVFAYLDDVYGRPGVVGFKIMYANLVRYPELWAYVVTRRVRVLHLVRSNLLDVVVSEHVRETTRTAHRIAGEPELAIEPMRIDPVDLVARVRWMRRRIRAVRTLLRASLVRRLEVTYEALVREPRTFERVCDFLSLERPDVLPASHLEKLVKRPASEILRNYDEVARALDAAGLASAHRDEGDGGAPRLRGSWR